MKEHRKPSDNPYIDQKKQPYSRQNKKREGFKGYFVFFNIVDNCHGKHREQTEEMYSNRKPDHVHDDQKPAFVSGFGILFIPAEDQPDDHGCKKR